MFSGHKLHVLQPSQGVTSPYEKSIGGMVKKLICKLFGHRFIRVNLGRSTCKKRERIAKELKEEAIANDAFYRKLRKDYEEIDNETLSKFEKELEEGYKAMAGEHKRFAKLSAKAVAEVVPIWK